MCWMTCITLSTMQAIRRYRLRLLHPEAKRKRSCISAGRATTSATR